MFQGEEQIEASFGLSCYAEARSHSLCKCDQIETELMAKPGGNWGRTCAGYISDPSILWATSWSWHAALALQNDLMKKFFLFLTVPCIVPGPLMPNAILEFLYQKLFSFCSQLTLTMTSMLGHINFN